MRINITGKVKKADRQEVREAVHFFAGKLMPPSVRKKLTINVHFSSELDPDTLAECVWLGDNPNRPKRFMIRVWDKATQAKRIKALGHEMVHVKQHARGELRDIVSSEEYVNWKGKRHRHACYIGTDEDYWFSPWEIEAYGMEAGLNVLWKKSVRAKKRASKKKK